MRKVRLLLALLLLLLELPVNAYDFKKDGIFYNIEGDEATVTYEVYGEDAYRGDVVIPFKVTYNGKSYRVTKIGWHAFYLSHHITSVTIPSSIEYIDSQAFEREINTFFDIYISDLEAWFNIDYSGWTFYDKGRIFLNGNELKDLIIPSGLTTIEGYALSCCDSFVSVLFPNSVKTIGSFTFWRCSNLSSVTIPKSVTSIGSDAFSGCTSLKTIISEIEKPFDLSESPFDESTYQTAELIVPKGTRRAYLVAEGWRNFVKITEVSDESSDNELPTNEQQMEFFYDKDPGYGNAHSVSCSIGDNQLSLNTDELDAGTHIIYIRSKDSKGRWSATVSRPLYVCRNLDITTLEYYFDNLDPGYGHAYQVAVPKKHGGTIAFSGNIDRLLPGQHQLNVRAKNCWGVWTLLSSESFTIIEGTGIREVKADFGFDIHTSDGICTITPRSDCQRGDCRVEITDLSGRVVSNALWKDSVSQIKLPVHVTSQVYIIKITNTEDGRQFIKRIILGK